MHNKYYKYDPEHHMMRELIERTVEEVGPDIFKAQLDYAGDVLIEAVDLDLEEQEDTLTTDKNVFNKAYEPHRETYSESHHYSINRITEVVFNNPDAKVTIYTFKSAMAYRGYSKADEIIPHTPPDGNNLQLLTHLESCYKEGFVNKDEASTVLLQYIQYYGSTYHHDKVKEIGKLLFEGGWDV